MNNRRLLIAAEFHFVHPVEKKKQLKHKLNSEFSRPRSCAAHKHNIFHMNFKKVKLEPAIT